MASFNPENSGRGVWWVIHSLAKNQDAAFPGTMTHIRDNFFCSDVCRPHIKSYMQRNPLPRDSRMWFEWSVNFHNNVNQRLGKPIISLDEAYMIYSDHRNEDGSCASCTRIDNQPRTQNHVHYFQKPNTYQNYQPFRKYY